MERWVEKFLYVLSLTILWLEERLQMGQFAVVFPDCVLGTLFVLAHVKVNAARRQSH